MEDTSTHPSPTNTESCPSSAKQNSCRPRSMSPAYHFIRLLMSDKLALNHDSYKNHPFSYKFEPLRYMMFQNSLQIDEENCLVVSSRPETQRDCTLPTQQDCVLTEWSMWTTCCDSTQHRTRSVLVAPHYGGQPCPQVTLQSG